MFEEACDWQPTVNLRWFDGILQQEWRRVVVEWKKPPGGFREMRYQSVEREWRDIPREISHVRG